MKLSFLLYIFSIFFLINTLFIDDLTFHDIFISEGKLDILYNIKTLVFIALISYAIKNILVQIVFTENDIISIRKEDNYINREEIKHSLTSVTVKCYLFFTLSILSLGFIWTYLACFFTVFKNTQIFAIKNTFMSFGISMVIPFITGIIVAPFRLIALSSKESKNRFCIFIFYKILQIFA